MLECLITNQVQYSMHFIFLCTTCIDMDFLLRMQSMCLSMQPSMSLFGVMRRRIEQSSDDILLLEWHSSIEGVAHPCRPIIAQITCNDKQCIAGITYYAGRDSLWRPGHEFLAAFPFPDRWFKPRCHNQHTLQAKHLDHKTPKQNHPEGDPALMGVWFKINWD